MRGGGEWQQMEGTIRSFIEEVFQGELNRLIWTNPRTTILYIICECLHSFNSLKVANISNLTLFLTGLWGSFMGLYWTLCCRMRF